MHTRLVPHHPFTRLPMSNMTGRTTTGDVAYVVALVAVGVQLACSRADRADPAQASNAVRADAQDAAAVPSATLADTLRVSAGAEHTDVAANAVNWDAETVAGHLTGRGLMVDAVGVVARPMFRVHGQRYRVNGGRAFVEAYFYGDANTVGFDTDQLDTVQVMPKGGTMRWEMPARLIVDNNMAAVVLTEDAALRRKVESALRSALRTSTRDAKCASTEAVEGLKARARCRQVGNDVSFHGYVRAIEEVLGE